MRDKGLELGDLKVLHTRLVRDLLAGHCVASSDGDWICRSLPSQIKVKQIKKLDSEGSQVLLVKKYYYVKK